MLAIAGALLLAGPAVAAPKTDVVYLRNGDRLTCEIKKLAQGRFTISTDPLNTVTVHWGEIAGLTSPRDFDITMASGERFFGSLGLAAAGQLAIVARGASPTVLRLTDVIALVPIGSSIWNRMDGNLNAGFSFAQANLETHGTVNGTAAYRSRKYSVSGSLASQVTVREDATSLSRNSLTLSANRLMDRRWYSIALSQLQQNEELDLDFRTVVGGGFGREFVHSNHRLLSLFAGLVYTREQFTNEPVDQSAEAVFGGVINFFTPAKEEISFKNQVVSFYNVSGRGRVRVELQSSWRHEFLKDFNWSLDGYESFDSSPPPDGKQNDVSISLSLGWKF